MDLRRLEPAIDHDLPILRMVVGMAMEDHTDNMERGVIAFEQFNGNGYATLRYTIRYTDGLDPGEVEFHTGHYDMATAGIALRDMVARADHAVGV